MLVSYSWLKSYIKDIPEVDKITDLITFHLCEIESVEKKEDGDAIFDLKILPDRAHDLLSHQGVAREVASLLGLEFKLPEYKLPESEKDSPLQIEIEDPGCIRYMGRIVRNIKVGPSPEWMVKYLESVGQRSINNIVDATNIVMLDCGQPIHAFDLSKLSSEKIIVKNANDGDTLELVGSEKIKANLKGTDLMITDGVNNLAIAGVKGGLLSGISDTTTDILIEVANFDAVSVRKTARRLGIQSDASKRYENKLSPTLCDFAMKEISALVLEMCGDATFEKVVDVYNNVPVEKKISFDSVYISKVLGVKISSEDIEKILNNYKYEFTKNGDSFELKVPNMRLDIEGAHDMAEEIGRVYGYDKIIPEIPHIDSESVDNSTWTNICLAKEKLVSDGYKEVMNYVFQDKGEVQVLASASDKKFLRDNLTDSLKESIKLNTVNLPLLEMDEVKVFEVGTIFTKEGEQINVAYGDKKNITEMTLEEFMKEKVSAEEFVKNATLQKPLKQQIFKSWSIYPFITRDIAVWIPERMGPEKLVSIYKDFGTELLVKEPKLFDSFTKDGRTSFAYRLVFQSDDRTLTNEEVDTIMLNITNEIKSLGFEVR
ncbi:MAG TPA: phenylalanine--tRNA ligase subunit beta [Candidatus Paceibacterota bacterium]|nr:phenylalanine--tRNA ligase subunit beta [Candidatus Paceibacterota bacterium]